MALVADDPLIEQFYRMTLLRRWIVLDDECRPWVTEIRKDARTGERQRLTYLLDTPPELH